MQHWLSYDDEFVVLASDGLWDKLSNEEAVGLVYDTVKQPTMAAQRYLGSTCTRLPTNLGCKLCTAARLVATRSALMMRMSLSCFLDKLIKQ